MTAPGSAWRRCAGSAFATLVAAGQPAVAQDAVAAGLRLMTDRAAGNCVACHAIPGQRGIASTFGPDLGGIGARRSDAELRQWVADARQIKPDALMPPFGTVAGTSIPAPSKPVLTDEQIAQVVAALQGMR